MTIVACGGAHPPSRHAPGAARSQSLPPNALATFDCSQWLAAPAATRATVVRALHGFYGGPVSGKRRTRGYGTVLSDSQAQRLFDGYCRQPYARNFTLYKLYARAAAFTGGPP
jgi:hypothetical protein